MGVKAWGFKVWVLYIAMSILDIICIFFAIKGAAILFGFEGIEPFAFAVAVGFGVNNFLERDRFGMRD